MHPTLIAQLPARAAGYALALLGARHGYRFDGDTVYLNAMFTVMSPAAHERSWALQLWATPTAPTRDADFTGRLVAQALLPPIGEIADESFSFETSAFALLPTSPEGHYMVLTLVAGRGGDFTELHDLVLLPQRQTFQPLRLGGELGYLLQGDRVRLSVEKIANPRGPENRSGTLSLELWALPTPFRGGVFAGAPLAGVTLDSLAGLQEYSSQSFDLPFAAPPAGTWHLVLMLREWTPAGFVTRDFTNFPTPYFQPQPPPPPPVVAAPLVFAPQSLLEVEPLAVFETPVIEPPTSHEPLFERPVAQLPATPAKPSVPKKPRRRQLARPLAALSINTASARKLSSVKWLSKRASKGIVTSRPFTALDDLLRVKGIGPKVLARILPRLKL